MPRSAVFVALAAFLAAGAARAQDFEGTWKIPEAQALAAPRTYPACNDVTACLRIAWMLEAGVRFAAVSDAERHTEAGRYHARACELAKLTPCKNAERITAQAARLSTMESSGRARFWCALALDGAKRFAKVDGVADEVVRSACRKVLPAGTALSIDLVASASSEQRPQLVRLLLDDVLAEICPTLKVRPAECTLDAASVPSAKQPAVVRAILRGAFPELTAAQRAELADRVLRDR